MPFKIPDHNETIKRYSERFIQHGHSPLSLGWNKGKQSVRFDILTSQINLRGKTILDFGCGFGDLNKTLISHYGNNYNYIGLDIVPCLLDAARNSYPQDNIKFEESDLLNFKPKSSIDVVISSGVFNHKYSSYTEKEQYSYIFSNLKCALNLAKVGIAFDFLSSKVDFRHQHTFHADPVVILDYMYSLSRNIIIRNDYMPFEFAMLCMKNDCFDPADTLFYSYKQSASSS